MAADFPDLLSIVVDKVRPEREKSKRDKYRELWWQFAERAVDLHRKLQEETLKRVMATNCGASPHLAFAYLPANVVFSHTLAIITDVSFATFAVLQSRVHEYWARLQGSTMKDDLRYTPTDCFATYPMPVGWNELQELVRCGERYHDCRAQIMQHHQVGLTTLYNWFNSPESDSKEINELREMHTAMDRAVLDAYGWTDIQPSCEFIPEFDDEDDEDEKDRPRKNKYRYRWPDEIRDEVLARCCC